MKRALLATMICAVSAAAHHGYRDYDRATPVAIEGTVKNILWGNPHVLITLQTEGRGEYSVEWGALYQLSRWGVNAPPVKLGDRIVVTGSVNRNPERHILTLVREISRPSDGWRWADPRYSAGK